MQQKDSPDAIAAKFVTLAEEEGECKLRGDYKRGNLLVKKINRLVSSIQNEPEMASSVLQRSFPRHRDVLAVLVQSVHYG